MQLRVYYMNHADEVRTTDIDVPDRELDHFLEDLAQARAGNTLFIANEARQFAFAVPAKRVLEVERLPWS